MSQSMTINAGRKKVGNVLYENYVGQVKPADMSKIIWYGVGGNDATGDGSISNPYLTATRGRLDAGPGKEYLLNIDLDGARELSSLIYWNPATGNDANTGLTPAQAVQSYAQAKVQAAANSKTRIEALTSFTMTDYLDFATQGEIGETLNYDVAPVISSVSANVKTAAGEFMTDAAQNEISGVIIAIADATSTLKIYRSTNGGQTFASISNPWSAAGSPRGITYANGVWVVCGDGASVGRVLLSTDDGLTWTENAVTGKFYDVVWSGQNFVICGKDTTGTAANYIKTSPDGITWTDRTDALGTPATMQLIKMATDGAGTVMIVGYDGGTGKMELSTDHGVTWADYSGSLSGSGKVKQVAYGNGVWLIRRAAGATRFHTSTVPATTWTAGPTGLQEMDSGDPYGASISYSPILDAFLYCDPSYPALYYVTPSAATLIAVTGSDSKYFFALSLLRSGAEYAFCGGFTNTADGLIDAVPIYPTNIHADCANLVIDIASDLRAGFANRLSAITCEPTSGQAAYFYESVSVDNSRIISLDADSASFNAWLFSVSKCLFKSPMAAMKIYGKALVQDDISVTRSVIAGAINLVNTGGTNKELFEDLIIEGNFTASAIVDLKSGNIRGSGNNINLLPPVTQIDPLFIDTTDYKPQRELLGALFDSYMIQRSAFFQNGLALPADWGAWSSEALNVAYIYQRSFDFLLPSKPDAVQQIKHNRANLKVSENGTPDVVNTPTGRWEELTLNYGALPQDAQGMADHIAFLDYIESLIDMTCELTLDKDYIPATAVTTSAAASAGDVFIDIVAANIKAGDRLTIGGAEYQVLYLVGSTRLVLSQPLAVGVANAQSIPVLSPVGYGVYQYVPPQERRLSRWQFNRTDFLRGVALRFVRKWPGA